MPVNFRFDPDEHEYTNLDTGQVLPHITGMLERCGYGDPRWYTEASRERGTAVHKLTAAWDMGALQDASCTKTGYADYAGWLQAHIHAREKIRPLSFEAIEEPDVHPVYLYGGRTDRRVLIYGMKGVLELKTGAEEKGHMVQTALQAMLAEEAFGIPAELIARFCLYLKRTGKFVLEQHKDQGDFMEAHRVIRACC